jgi:hypothetical protein
MMEEGKDGRGEHQDPAKSFRKPCYFAVKSGALKHTTLAALMGNKSVY